MHLRSVRIHAHRFPDRGSYPFNQRVLQETPRIDFTTPVTFFIGENGAGKTTLIEALCRRCGIHLWRSQERTRYEANPHEEQLYRFIDVEWADGPVPGAFFGADTFRYFAHSLDEWAAADPGMLEYFGGESLVTKSHGQSLMAYFRSRYERRGLYILDEPETALSPRNQVALTRIFAQTGRHEHAQFVVATHSPILLACPGASILSFDSAPVMQVDYRQTDYYRLYRDFLADPEGHIAGGVTNRGDGAAATI